MSAVPEMLPESKELLENQRRTWAGITSIEEKRRAWSVYARSLWQPPPASLVVAVNTDADQLQAIAGSAVLAVESLSSPEFVDFVASYRG